MAWHHHSRRSHIGSGLWGLQPVGPVRFAVRRKIRPDGYDHASPGDQGSGPATPRCRPRLCTSCCQRSPQPRRERHQHAVGKSEHRRAWHRDPDRVGLHSGRPDMPRFSGELCHRQFAILVARGSLQAKARRLGSSYVQALEIQGFAVLSIVKFPVVGRWWCPRCIFCAQTPH